MLIGSCCQDIVWFIIEWITRKCSSGECIWRSCGCVYNATVSKPNSPFSRSPLNNTFTPKGAAFVLKKSFFLQENADLNKTVLITTIPRILCGEISTCNVPKDNSINISANFIPESLCSIFMKSECCDLFVGWLWFYLRMNIQINSINNLFVSDSSFPHKNLLQTLSIHHLFV